MLRLRSTLQSSSADCSPIRCQLRLAMISIIEHHYAFPYALIARSPLNCSAARISNLEIGEFHCTLLGVL